MLGRNREWCNKNIYNVTIYKTLKRTERTTLKLPLAMETLIWLKIKGWVGGSLLRCSCYDEYLASEQEDFCEWYIKFKGNWELLPVELLVILLKIAQLQLNGNWEVKPVLKYKCHFVSENKSINFLICFAQTKITLFIFVYNWVIRENKSFLIVEPFSRVPKSRGNEGVSCLIFEADNNDSRLFSIYLNSLEFYNMKSVCLFIYLLVLCASRISCLYLSLWNEFVKLLRHFWEGQVIFKLFQCTNFTRNWDVNLHSFPIMLFVLIFSMKPLT